MLPGSATTHNRAIIHSHMTMNIDGCVTSLQCYNIMVHVSADNIVTLRQILHSRTNRWLRGKAARGI